MAEKYFAPTFPNSFGAMGVGESFFALDMAGLTTATTPFVGVRIERDAEDEWTLDTFRVHSSGPTQRLVRVERYQVSRNADGTWVRTATRGFPPNTGPRTGHYRGKLPPEIVALLTQPFDVSSRQP